MSAPAPLAQRLEDIAVRIMYLLTTLETFLIFSSLPVAILAGMDPRTPFSWAAMVLTYALFRSARFFPLVLIGLPVYLILLLTAGGAALGDLLGAAGIVFVIATGIQLATQGLPHLVASRDSTVPFRMWFNSLWTLAPTTLSLPVSTGFGALLAWVGIAGKTTFLSAWGWLFWASLTAGVLLARKYAPRTYLPSPRRPRKPLPRPCRRVILLNIDGLSFDVYRKAKMPFLKKLAADYTEVSSGAITVCRALTNPAFASILTGAPPDIHGVRNNNIGQTIRIEALPDIIPTRLYGSMHVKHFSKPDWEVSVFSLVGEGAWNVDPKLFAKLKEDILNYPATRLFVADLSLVDFIGHSYGHYSKRYFQAASFIDSLIREFWDWLAEHGLRKETALIISSDHGLFVVEHSYLISRTEKYVPLIFAGTNITRGVPIKGAVSIMDINSTVSYLLGSRYCENSRGGVPIPFPSPED